MCFCDCDDSHLSDLNSTFPETSLIKRHVCDICCRERDQTLIHLISLCSDLEDQVIPPCGACRQVIREVMQLQTLSSIKSNHKADLFWIYSRAISFSIFEISLLSSQFGDIPVFMTKVDGSYTMMTLEELLPLSWGAEYLRKQEMDSPKRNWTGHKDLIDWFHS